MNLRHAMRVKNGATYTPVDIQTLEKIFSATFGLDCGITEDIRTAERLSPIAAAHRIMTNAQACMPIQFYRKVNGARQPESVPDLNRVLNLRANDTMSSFLERKIVLSEAFWYGVGYSYIERHPPSGKVTGLIPLPTSGHQVKTDPDTGQRWYIFQVDGETRRFQSSELLIHFFETYDGKIGRGVLSLAREAIAGDAAAQRFGRKFYANGARLSGVVQTDDDLSKASRNKIRDEIEQYAAGMDRAFKIAVLDNGLKFSSLGLSQADAQYIQTRQFSVQEVSRFTGIPEYMLQSGKQAYNSNEQQQIDFLTNTMLPHLIGDEQEMAYKLFSTEQLRKGMYLRHNVDALMRADSRSRAEFYQKMVYSGVYNPDECRALEEKDPIPGGAGQKFFMTKNLDTIDHIAGGGESK